MSADDAVVDMGELLLSGLVPASSQPQVNTPPPPPPVPQQAIPPSVAGAAAQAMPGTPAPTKGPQVVSMPTVVPRAAVVSGQQQQQSDVKLDLTSEASFESNLGQLIAKDLSLAQHDRALAVALLRVHLDRAEVLDAMPLSMPVAQVIGDNTGATLKALELAMKAGERLHKTAELLVSAQKNADSAALAALKMKMLKEQADGGWGSEVPGGG